MGIILGFIIAVLVILIVFMIIGFEIRYGQLHDEWMDQNVTIDLQASQLNKTNKKVADLENEVAELSHTYEEETEKLEAKYEKKIDTYKVKIKGLNESVDILLTKEAGYLNELKVANEEIENLRDIIMKLETVEEGTPDKEEEKPARKRAAKKKEKTEKVETSEGAAKVEKKRGRRKKVDAA